MEWNDLTIILGMIRSMYVEKKGKRKKEPGIRSLTATRSEFGCSKKWIRMHRYMLCNSQF